MADEERFVGELEIERSIYLRVDEPGFRRPVLLQEGQAYRVKEDGDTAPVDDLSNTIWEKYAEEAERLFDATEEAVRLATEEHVNLQRVEGAGEDGRILVGDVRDFIEDRNS